MKSLSLVQKILLGLLAILILIQFFGIDKTNPPINMEEDFIQIHQPPVAVAGMIKAACYDCHSHETKYPWYTNVAPVSWWIGHHIEEGREHLNFSTFGSYPLKRAHHKIEECFEEIEKGKMPLETYPIMHAEAKLSEQQKAQLITYFKSIEQKLKKDMANE